MQKYENWSSERAASVVRQHADRASATLSVAHAKARNVPLEIVRTRRFYRLEPMFEIETGTAALLVVRFSASLNHNLVKKGPPDGE